MSNIKISLRNYSKDKETYKKYRKQLIEILKRSSENFKMDIRVLVKISDFSEGYTLDGRTSATKIAYVIMKKDYATLTISSNVFEIIEKNKILDLEILFCHEFAHIFDLSFIGYFPYFKNCSVDELNINTKRNYNIKTGIHFWSEFFAYYITYRRYRRYYNFYTNPCELEFIYLAAGAKLYEAKHEKKLKKQNAFIDEMFEAIGIFVYNFALYIASLYVGDKRRIRNKGKIYTEKSMGIVMQILRDLEEYIHTLIQSRHNKKFVKNLEKLGHYINYKIYNRFGCKIRKDNGNYIMAFNMKQLKKSSRV